MLAVSAPRELDPVARPEGLYVPALDLHLDPSTSVRRAFFSHAHGALQGCTFAEAFASPETTKLLAARFGVVVTRAIGWADSLAIDAPIGTVDLSLARAGHVLGAAQLVADTSLGRLVYAGEIRTAPGWSHAGGSVVPCDVLILDATYALPIFRFPERALLADPILAIARGCLDRKDIPVFLAQALGKTQELAALFAGAGVPFVVHPSAIAPCEVYAELGVELGDVRPWSDAGAARAAWIIPPAARAEIPKRERKRARIVLVSGAARIDAARERYDADHVVPLSDHADFDALLDVVRRSGAARVFTAFGHAAPFAAILRGLGLDARPIEVLGPDTHEAASAAAAGTARRLAVDSQAPGCENSP